MTSLSTRPACGTREGLNAVKLFRMSASMGQSWLSALRSLQSRRKKHKFLKGGCKHLRVLTVVLALRNHSGAYNFRWPLFVFLGGGGGKFLHHDLSYSEGRVACGCELWRQNNTYLWYPEKTQQVGDLDRRHARRCPNHSGDHFADLSLVAVVLGAINIADWAWNMERQR